MRNRAIDNYLSREEIELISAFLQLSMNRFEKYDGLTRLVPSRYNADELQKLYISKYNLWEKAINTARKQSGNLFPCPIEQFLKTFKQVIEQGIPPSKLNDMLQKLETELIECEFSCPCPSEP